MPYKQREAKKNDQNKLMPYKQREAKKNKIAVRKLYTNLVSFRSFITY